MSRPKLSVIIPCFNEEATILDVIRRVQAVALKDVDREIIVVDDGSTDRTREALRAADGVRLVLQERNGGKGAAVRAGFAAAGGDVLLIQDADLEYDPADHPAVIAPILEERADFVMGSRFLYERPTFFRGEHRSPLFTHYLGNILIIRLTNLLYGQSATDYEGAYKAFSREALRRAGPIQAAGFEFDNELVCKLLRRGLRMAEVPIRYHPRSYEQGKKIRWHHGARMLWTIAQWRWRRF